MIASTTWSTRSPRTATSMRVLGTKSTTYFGAAIQLGVSPLPAEALHFRDRHARTADVGQRRRTSSSLKGLMIAVTSFMSLLSVCEVCGAKHFAVSCHAPETGPNPGLRGARGRTIGKAHHCRASGRAKRPVLVRPRLGPWAILAQMYQQIVIAGGGQAAVQAVDTLRRKRLRGKADAGGR